MKKTNKTTTERTRVITATITIIEKVKKGDNSSDPANRKETMKAVADSIKKQLKADDVQVKSVKDFLLEK